MFSFTGDTVLDPFLGSGTTVLAAIEAGRNSVGNELDQAYFVSAERRIKQAIAQQDLFESPPTLSILK